MERNRVALVGCGRWGRLIARDLADLGALVTVVDPSDAAGAFASETGLDRLDSTVGLAGLDIDGAVVATPASTHATTLFDLADLGVPVFCEKPLTVDVGEAEHVVDLYGDRLHVMHVWRYHRGVELLGELARSGELGAVQGVRTTRTNWTSPRTDVDSIWTLAPHDLTIGIEVLGEIPPPKAALAEVIDGRAVSLWAHLGGGGEPWLVVEASTRSAERRREVRVHGSLATATLIDDGSNTVVIAAGSELDPRPRSISFDPEPPLRRELAAWLEFIAGGDPPKSDGAEGLEVVRRIAELRTLAGLDSISS